MFRQSQKIHVTKCTYCGCEVERSKRISIVQCFDCKTARQKERNKKYLANRKLKDQKEKEAMEARGRIVRQMISRFAKQH